MALRPRPGATGSDADISPRSEAYIRPRRYRCLDFAAEAWHNASSCLASPIVTCSGFPRNSARSWTNPPKSRAGASTPRWVIGLLESFEPRWSWLLRPYVGEGGRWTSQRSGGARAGSSRALTVAAAVAVVAGTALGVGGGNDSRYQPGSEAKVLSEFGRAPVTGVRVESSELMARNAFFMSRRTAGTAARRRHRRVRSGPRAPGLRRGSARARRPPARRRSTPPGAASARTRSCRGSVAPEARSDSARWRPDRRHRDEAGRHDSPRWRAGRHLEVDRRRQRRAPATGPR